jgi:glyoxylase-like metal-dependent hydrolase (beta-lactamase superfamily II)
MHRITDNLYSFSNLLVGRVYCITDPDGLTVIDAGLGLAAKRIVSQLKRAGYALTDVKRILITHGHPDHVGGLPALKAATGAQVIASAYERPYIEGKKALPQPKREEVPLLARMMVTKPQTMAGTPVDRTITDGDLLAEVFGGLRAVATPGHSPGHMSFWQPERRILITGDVVMRLPWLRLPFAAFTSDMAQSKRSLKHAAELGADMICFGHGVPMTRNAAARLKAFAEKW